MAMSFILVITWDSIRKFKAYLLCNKTDKIDYDFKSTELHAYLIYFQFAKVLGAGLIEIPVN